MKVFVVLFLIPLTACVGMTPLSSSSSSSSAPRASGADPNGQVTMPDVFKLPRDQATAALRRAGVQGEIHEEASLCGTVVNGRIVETGEVCEQQPAAGRQQGARLSVTVRFQTEDPRHGDAGKPTEWRLMPNLVGLTFEQALVAMRRAGYVETNGSRKSGRTTRAASRRSCAASIRRRTPARASTMASTWGRIAMRSRWLRTPSHHC